MKNVYYQKTLSNTRQVKLVQKKYFIAAGFKQEYETALLTSSDLGVHLFCRLQIASLIPDKTFTIIPFDHNTYDSFNS